MEEDRNGCIKCNPFQRAELTERKLDFSENPVLRSPGRRVCGRPELARKRKKKWFNVGLLAQVFADLHFTF